MNLRDVRIYSEGVEMGRDCEEKIRKIVNVIKSLSPSSEVGMRFLKNGHTYEGMLWGKANDIPIGVYNRGASMSHVLDALLRRVRKQSLKIWKLNRVRSKPKATTNVEVHSPFAMVG